MKYHQEEAPDPEQPEQSGKLTSRQFQSLASDVLSNHFGVPLTEKKHSSIPKKFDYISDDETIVGDAKYYTMVRGKFLPPAKFATIAEHVWLLEKTQAESKFLVFGNDKTVPTEWLRRYGHLVAGIDFFFMTDSGNLSVLTR